jgi:hypothetical protein
VSEEVRCEAFSYFGRIIDKDPDAVLDLLSKTPSQIKSLLTEGEVSQLQYNIAKVRAKATYLVTDVEGRSMFTSVPRVYRWCVHRDVVIYSAFEACRDANDCLPGPEDESATYLKLRDQLRDKTHIFTTTVDKIACAKVEKTLLSEIDDFNLESDQVKYTRPDLWPIITSRAKAYACALKQICDGVFTLDKLESLSDFPDNYKDTILLETPEIQGVRNYNTLGDLDASIMRGVTEIVERNVVAFFEAKGLKPVFSRHLRVMSMLGTITFNLTIVSCELDMVGYVLGSLAYYETSAVMGKLLICAMPVAYVLCILIRLSGVISRTRLKGLENDVLSWYHVVPMTRYVLFFKVGGAGENDVLQLFRVNTLSSFTLGIAMLVSTGIYYASGGVTNMYTVVSLVSQAASWLVTILYFTPVAKFMKVLTQVDQDIRLATAAGMEVFDRKTATRKEAEKWKDDLYDQVSNLLNVPKMQIEDLVPRYSHYQHFVYMNSCALTSRAESKINVMLGRKGN